MEIFDRVRSNVNLCRVALAFGGTVMPSVIESWQPFYNSTLSGSDLSKVYSSLGSINFAEESEISAAGTSYKQSVSFTFPATDSHRSERIALLQKIKFVTLILDNGQSLLIGRNDFNQNSLPTVKVKTNEQLCQVEIENKTIFPSGFAPSPVSYGLPGIIPISFIL